MLAVGLLPTTPAFAASPPGTVATGDPAPPADPTVPGGLDQPAPIPDESIVESPPTASTVVQNANALLIAWVGTPADRPAGTLLTLQAALNAAPAGGTVSFDRNDYAFTGALLVPRAVTLDTGAASVLYARFTVNGGGLALTPSVTIGAANTGAIVTVAVSGATLTGITITNPTPVARPTGIQLAGGTTGVAIDAFRMDGAGEASSYGINLTTGSATITDPAIVGVATGITVTAASTAAGISLSGGTFTAATSGVSLGSAAGPQVSGVDVTGPAGAGTGVDLAASSGAIVTAVTVHGFSRGIGASTTNAGAGPVITDAVIDGSSREGISLGASTGPRVVDAQVTGTGASQSTGILTLMSTAAVIQRPVISGVMYGITTSAANTGVGPAITSPTISAFGGVTLGSTQGASVTGAVLSAGGAVGGTGINLVNSGRATITDESATGFLYAIANQSTVDPGSDRANIAIARITVLGAPNSSHGVSLLGARNATITDVVADITGAALVIHDSIGVQATNITVHGHEGLTSVTGASILRAYDSQNVNVDGASIDAGSYGFFYSATDGSTVTNATVANLVEYGLYGRSVAHLDVSATTFTNNSAVGLFIVTTPANGISHDIAIHGTTMTGNDDGILALQGTTAVTVSGNTVSGQPNVVTAGPAHDLLVTGNTITQAGDPDQAAVTVAPLWEDGSLAGSYSSSSIRVTRNTFSGNGTWISVGTADAASAEAARRTLRDPVFVTGNTFPRASVGVHTYPNAVVGADTAPLARLARISPFVAAAGGPVAVDARDYDDPNDWGSPCRATGYLDGALYYDGGGAEVRELTAAPVLYPMNCIDLSLSEAIATTGTTFGPGDQVTWTLTPHNEGPRVAPAGWSITQLLPPGVELVSMSGPGYSLSGMTAEATSDLAVNADGPTLTVVVRIIDPPPGETTMHNVAFVAPAPTADLDGDGFADAIVERVSPLDLPTLATDTDTSTTDNDAQGFWTAWGAPLPTPTDAGDASLPFTGTDPAWPLRVGAGLLLLGVGIQAAYRVRQFRRGQGNFPLNRA